MVDARLMTPLLFRLDHKSFAEAGPLALLDNARYPVLVHRLAASLRAAFPRSVALVQLRFVAFALLNLRENFQLQGYVRTGRTEPIRLPYWRPGRGLMAGPIPASSHRSRKRMRTILSVGRGAHGA